MMYVAVIYWHYVAVIYWYYVAVIYWHYWCIYIFYRVEGGELFDKVVSLGQYDEATAKLLFYQIVCAVKVCSVKLHLNYYFIR